MRHLDIILPEVGSVLIENGPNGYIAIVIFKDGSVGDTTAYTIEQLSEQLINMVEERLY